MNNAPHIAQLRAAIEASLHHKLRTPKDFDFLTQQIWERQHEYVSATTLKRLWGYLENDTQPRTMTLTLLSRFLGYHNWDDFIENSSGSQECQSQFVMSRHINVKSQLAIGDQLRLMWHPRRVCDIEYRGNLSFMVIASENTRLHEGDTFECSLIIEGEPLYLGNVRQETDGKARPAIAYVCGRQTGVMFEYLS